VFFSPLAGDALPPCDALWLPGGYPELHAAALAARHDLRAQLHAHAQAGRPIWAECGGMMTLFEELTLADGHSHRLWGLLPGRVRMQKKLAGLGMQQWAAPGGTLRGHSFHYSTCQTPLAPAALTQPAEHSARRQGEPVYAHGSVRASYFHAWFASSLPATAQLFGSAAGGHAAAPATAEGGA
ncbi:MAG: cobyrinic acid a,c-diamide synthase, partial [Comamonadaceae bacterium]|nr:cobyrinic acid a,c-diamide synthase [Comamonadaceae bacterium]